MVPLFKQQRIFWFHKCLFYQEECFFKMKRSIRLLSAGNYKFNIQLVTVDAEKKKLLENKTLIKKNHSFQSDFENKIESFKSYGNFTRLGLSERFDETLENLNIEYPTDIQKKMIPQLLALKSGIRQPNEERKNLVIASETGSGKTLGFLMPLMELIKRDEAIFGIEKKIGRPKILILTPTRELAVQISKVAKLLSHGIKLRVDCVTGGMFKRLQKRVVQSPIDIVISTPGHALAMRDRQKSIFLGSVRHLVVDEADVVTGYRSGFREDLEALIKPMEDYGSLINKVWVGATTVISLERRKIQQLLRSYGRDTQTSTGILWIRERAQYYKERLDVIKSSNVGKLPFGLKFDVAIANETSKHPVLLSVLMSSLKSFQANSSNFSRSLIFCNSLASCRSTCYAVESNSDSHEIQMFSVNGEMPPGLRARQIDMFLSNDQDTGSSCKHKVLITTDILSRGLDFNLEIEHVIMFDLPSSVSDFIHRIGRTARGPNSHGRVTLISKGTNKDERTINYFLASIPPQNIDQSVDIDTRMRSALQLYKHPILKHSSKHARLKKRKLGTKFVTFRRKETHEEKFVKKLKENPIIYSC